MTEIPLPADGIQPEPPAQPLAEGGRPQGGLAALVPVMPAIGPYELRAYPVFICAGDDGAGWHGTGWQDWPGSDGGPSFVIAGRNALGAVTLAERYPLTQDGWERAWRALVRLDPAIADQAAANLARRASRARGDAAPWGSGLAGPAPFVPGWARPGHLGTPVPSPRRMSGMAVAVLVIAGVLGCLVAGIVLLTVLWGLAGGDAPAPGTPPGFLGQLVFSPDGTTMAVIHPATASGPAHVAVSGTASGRVITTVTSRGGIAAVAFSPDGKTLAILAMNGLIYLRDAASGGLIENLAEPGRAERGRTVVFSPDGSALAASGADGSTYLFNVGTGALIGTLPDGLQSLGVLAITFSPDGKAVAVADKNGGTYLWHAPNGPWIATLAAPGGGPVRAVAFSPDGTMLASSDADGNTYLWDIARRQVAATLTDFVQGGDTIAFSPDGATVAEGDTNGFTHLWQVASGRKIATLDASNGLGIVDLAFSADGATIAVGYIGNDGNGSTYRRKV